MKRIVITLLTGIIVFAACNKNNDSPAGLQGSWITNFVVVNGYVNGTLIGSDTSTSGSITFNSDGTVTSVEDTNDPDTGTYIYDASSKQLNMISDDGDTTTVTVTNLTANNLHFVHDESTEADDGTVYRFTADADYKR